MYSDLQGVSHGYLYPVQKFFYTDPLYPTTVTLIKFYDQHRRIKMEIEISLVTETDISATPGLYSPGSAGNPKEILYYFYDLEGNKTIISS